MVIVWPQWWQTVGGSRDKILDLVAFVWSIRSRWLQPRQLWLGAGISSVALMLLPRDRDLCRVKLHPTWFEPISDCRSWPVASYLYGGYLPMGLYLGGGFLLLVGLLFHFLQCHSGLVSSRNEHVCPCHSVTRTGSWYGKLKGSRCLHPQLPAHRTLSQSRQLRRDGLGPCVGNSSAPDWWLWPQLRRGCWCLAVFWRVGSRLSHHSGNGGWWPLLSPLLIELSLGFLSGDHTFAYSCNDVVSLGIVIVRFWWKVGCPQGEDQFGIHLLCRGFRWLPLLWDQQEGPGIGSWLLSHLAWEGLVQDCNYSALAMELLQSCPKPSICISVKNNYERKLW